MLKTKILGALGIKPMDSGQIQNIVGGCMSEIEPALKELEHAGRITPDVDEGTIYYDRSGLPTEAELAIRKEYQEGIAAIRGGLA